VNLAPVNMEVRCSNAEDQAEDQAPKAAEHEEPKRRLSSSGVDYLSEEADEVRRLPHR